MKYGEPTKIFDITNKSALITGGTKGLGHEMAICLLENKCNVTIVSRSATLDDELLNASKASGAKVFATQCDACSGEDVNAMVDEAIADMGKIDILINGAGMNIRKFIWDMDDDSWDKVIRTNLTATFYVTRAVSKHMLANNYGKIINMSSMKSILGVSDDGYSAYCAAKSAINMFTKQAACELASSGITVNAIAPTFIKTEINANQLEDEEFRGNLEARIPVGRIGKFSDLMGYLLLLSSDASEFITGQTFLLDGGIAARQ